MREKTRALKYELKTPFVSRIRVLVESADSKALPTNVRILFKRVMDPNFVIPHLIAA